MDRIESVFQICLISQEILPIDQNVHLDWAQYPHISMPLLHLRHTIWLAVWKLLMNLFSFCGCPCIIFKQNNIDLHHSVPCTSDLLKKLLNIV